MDNITLFLNQLRNVKETGHNRWRASCPHHNQESNSQSLSIYYDEGKINFHCHAGCDPEVILSEMGFTWRIVYPPQTQQEINQWRQTQQREKYFKQRREDALLIKITEAAVRRGEPIPASDLPLIDAAIKRLQEPGP